LVNQGRCPEYTSGAEVRPSHEAPVV